MMTKEKYTGHVLILIVNILFAINITISKSLLPDQISPEGLTLLRMLFASVMFWITSLFTTREHVTRKDLGLLFLCSMTGIALNQGLFLFGLSQTSPIDASIISTASPIFVMVLAAIILKEPITRLKAFGVMLGATGAIALILSSIQVATGQSNMFGNLLCITSSFSYSIYLVIAKPITQRYSSVTMMKWMFLFAAIVISPFTYQNLLETPAFHGTISFQNIASILYVLIGATFIPYLLIPMSLKRIRPTTMSMYNYIQPMGASTIAIIIGQDTFSIVKLIAAAFVFGGVYMVTQSKSREDIEKAKEEKNKKK
ncbi:MAG: EamA family transporter [Parabacteroides sp.]|nr:EamA family transporter [Parabacteroides sp.]MBP9579025.1 EamA family transporter [Parabacteroides sp.]MDD2416329.1 DMT family transporter [Parabacteroides sp.]MDD4405637.1 DMT family transporter [Parabacteroides sp.]